MRQPCVWRQFSRAPTAKAPLTTMLGGPRQLPSQTSQPSQLCVYAGFDVTADWVVTSHRGWLDLIVT